MVKVLKPIVARKPEDIRKLKHSIGIVFGENIRQLKKKKGGKNDKTS